ncbi:MAG: hypothetical protein ACOYOL_07135 [Chthoniobacterales bacterium]
MTIATGRSRSLVFEGTFTGDAGGLIGIGGGYSRAPHFAVTACGCAVSLDITSVTVGASGGDFFVTVNGTLKASTPYSSHTEPISYTSRTAIPATNNDFRSYDGTWTITVPVEEFQIDEALAAVYLGSRDWPIYGGTECDDGPYPKLARFVERGDVAATVTATITCGAFTATSSHVLAAGEDYDAGYYCTTGLESNTISYNGMTTSHTISATRKFQSADLPLKASRSESNGSNSYSASTGNLSITNYNPGNVAIPQVDCAGFANSEWPAETAWRGRYRIYDQAGSDALQLTTQWKAGVATSILASGGAWSDDTTAYRESTGCTLNGATFPTQTLNEKTDLWCYVDGASATSFGDDPRDWRVLITGKQFDAFTLSHPATVLVENGSPLATWTSVNCAVVTGGADVVLGYTATGGTATATFGTAKNSECYRYLRFRIRSTVAGKKLRVTIGTKYWDITTVGTGYTDIDIDLCKPHNSTIAVDTKTSRYPLTGFLGDPVDSELWGVSRISTIVLTSFGTDTFRIDTIELRKDSTGTSWALATFESAFNNWATAWVSGSDTTYHKPFAWVDVSGKLADCPDMFKIVPSSGATTHNIYTITQLITLLGELGLTCAAVGSFPDAYHDNDLPAMYTAGNGATVDHSTGTWTEQLALDISSSITVQAHALWDMVSVPPLWGNGWAGGAYPSGTDALSARQTTIRFTKILRDHGLGLAHDPTTHAPRSGATVKQFHALPLALRGSDTTDTIGYYLTGTPFAQGNKAAYTDLQVATYPQGAYIAANRMRNRVSFGGLAPVDGTFPSLWIGPEQVHFRAIIKSGNAWVGVADNKFTSGYADADTGRAAVSVSICGEPNSKRRRLWLYIEDGGQIKEQYSDDAGGTWSMSVTVATGVKPASIFTRDGRKFVYWIETGSPNLIKGKIYDFAGNTLKATFTALSGVDDSGVDIAEYVSPSGIWRMELQTVISGAVVIYASTDGITFV